MKWRLFIGLQSKPHTHSTQISLVTDDMGFIFSDDEGMGRSQETCAGDEVHRPQGRPEAQHRNHLRKWLL